MLYVENGIYGHWILRETAIPLGDSALELVLAGLGICDPDWCQNMAF